MEIETTQILVLLSQICLCVVVFLLCTSYPEIWQLFLHAIIIKLTMPIHILHPDIHVTNTLKAEM